MILCESAFTLMETDEMNFKILERVAASLKTGGKFILTTLNALYALTHSLIEFMPEAQELHFDELTLYEHSICKKVDDDGNTELIKCVERFYMPSEIRWYLKSLGFKTVEIFGCPLGKWDRNIPLTRDEFEMLVVSQK